MNVKERRKQRYTSKGEKEVPMNTIFSYMHLNANKENIKQLSKRSCYHGLLIDFLAMGNLRYYYQRLQQGEHEFKVTEIYC